MHHFSVVVDFGNAMVSRVASVLRASCSVVRTAIDSIAAVVHAESIALPRTDSAVRSAGASLS